MSKLTQADQSLRRAVIARTETGRGTGSRYQLLSAVEDLISDQWSGSVETVQKRLDEYAAAHPKPEKEYPPKVRALAEHLGVDPDGIEYGDELQWEMQFWLVLTDAEADEAWEESLDQYLEDCVLPDVPERIRSYFDRDAWKRDASMDGRGHSLSSYDGNEYDVTVDGETFYLFRTN